MASESVRTATPADNDTSPRRSPSPASLQLLPSGQEMSEILQQMCGEISQTTAAESVAELEKKLYSRRNEVNRGESEPEINRLMKQVQELQLQYEKLQSVHNEVCVRRSVCVADDILYSY